MTITEQFKAKRCVFSIECFPPKQTTQMDKLKDTPVSYTHLGCAHQPRCQRPRALLHAAGRQCRDNAGPAADVYKRQV